MKLSLRKSVIQRNVCTMFIHKEQHKYIKPITSLFTTISEDFDYHTYQHLFSIKILILISQKVAKPPKNLNQRTKRLIITLISNA